MKIILTGGIAAGKSAAGAYLASRGYERIDADEVAREVTARPDVTARIADEFGADVVTESGVNRRVLRERVFASADATARLGALTHSAIYAELQSRLNGAGENCVLEIPLYFDTPYRLDGADEVWTVIADERTRIQRMLRRDNITVEQARDVLARQVGDNVRIAGSNRVLVNNGSPSDLIGQIEAALNGEPCVKF